MPFSIAKTTSTSGPRHSCLDGHHRLYLDFKQRFVIYLIVFGDGLCRLNTNMNQRKLPSSLMGAPESGIIMFSMNMPKLCFD